MKKIISLFLFFIIIWVLLAGFSSEELILGAFISLLVAVIFAKTAAVGFSKDILFKSVIFLTTYIPVFIWQLIKSNIDVAFRVLDPKLPISPGFVKVPVEITSDTGKLILANSITLTPGTISIDADDDNIYVHWIDVGEDPKKVSASFEKILRRIFK